MAAKAGKSSDAERRRKLRESLKSHYELQPEDSLAATVSMSTSGAFPPAHAAGPGSADPTSSIDSAAFNAAKHTTDMLKEKSLAQVVELDNMLRREVKSLDESLKVLVYDNYAKFISATDTIRQVRTNVSEMDSRLEALSTSVSAMDAVSRTVTRELAHHRERIEGVLHVNTVLRKLQFLVKLPDVLRRAIETGRLQDGVRYWIAGDGVLARYTHLPAFRETHQTARLMAEKLCAALCVDIVTRAMDGSPSAIVAKFEQRKHSAPGGDAQAPTGGANSNAGAAANAASATAPAAAAVDPSDPVGLKAALESLRLLAGSSIDVARAMKLEPQSGFSLTTGCNIYRAAYDAISKKALDAFRTGFEAVVKSYREDLLEHSIKRCQTACQSVSSKGFDVGALVVCLEHRAAKEALDHIHGLVLTLHSVLARLTNVIPASQLPGISAATVIMSAAQPLLASLLDTYAEVSATSIAEIASNVNCALARAGDSVDSDTARSALCAVANALATGAVDFSNGVRGIAKDNLRSEHFDHVKTFEGLVDAAVMDGLRALYDRLRILCDPASLSVGMQDREVPLHALAFASTARLFASVSLAQLREQNALVATDEIQFKELREKFEECGRRFTNTAIIVASIHVRDGFIAPLLSTLIATPPPVVIAPLAAWNDVTAEWARLYSACETLIVATASVRPSTAKAGVQHRRTGSNAGSASALSRNSGGTSAAGGGLSKAGTAGAQGRFTRVASFVRKEHAFASDVDRLFARPTGQGLTLRPSAIDAPHVMECILVASLTFALDFVRDVTLRTPLVNLVFQQLQVDAAYIMCVLTCRRDWYRRDERWTIVLDEMLAVAYERTAERVAMPSEGVLTIVNANPPPPPAGR